MGIVALDFVAFDENGLIVKTSGGIVWSEDGGGLLY